MNHSEYRSLTRSRLPLLVLVAGGVLGLFSACSSDGGNPAPSGPPVITTGGGGSGGKGSGEAGESSGGSPAQAGANSHAGNSNGGSGGAGVTGNAGEGGLGEGGEAGAAPTPFVACPSDGPTTDLGFLNRESTAQKAAFDNTKRLGAHATLPALP